MTGLIGFSWNRKSWVSKVIGFFRKSFYKNPPSHCFVVFGSLLDETIVGEASDPRIRLNPLSKYLNNKDKKTELWFLSTIPTAKKEEVCVELMDLVNKKYGYIQLFGFIIIWLCNKIGIKYNTNPFTQGMVCSEYVNHSLDRMGFVNEFLRNLDHNSIAPDHIHLAFSEDKRCVKAAICDFGHGGLEWTKEYKKLREGAKKHE